MKMNQLFTFLGELYLNLSLFFFPKTEPFQKPVSLEQHPDYAEYIFHPMDLCTLEKVKVKHLILKNQHVL